MLKILSVIAPIFLLVALGFVAVRLEWFPKTYVRALGAFVFNFALPALVFKALSQRSFVEILNTSYLVAYALGSLAVMALGICVAYFGKKKSIAASALYGIGMSSSNSAYIGYPIALQLVGPVAGVALALNMIVENALMIPLALALAESGTGDERALRSVFSRTVVGLIKNPFVLAIFAGLGCAVLRIQPPEPVARAIDMLSLACGSVALFVIGGTLVGLRIEGMKSDVARIVFGKLVLHPLAVFAMLMLLPPLDVKLQTAAITLACAPMLSIFPILGHKYGEEGLCAAALMAGTVASFFSISGVLWIFERQRDSRELTKAEFRC